MQKDNLLNSEIFKLHPEGLPELQRKTALEELKKYIDIQKENFLGYQANQNLSYENDLKDYLDIHINNIGDPFVDGNFTVNSKMMERAVLEYFAKLWNAKYPYDNNDRESFWGYTLSMGSTEGNVYAIWNARDYLGGKILLVDKGTKENAKKASLSGKFDYIPSEFTYYQSEVPKANPNAYTPVAFFSQDSHYSIVKAMRVMNFETFYSVGSNEFECPLKYPEDYPKGYSEKHIKKNGWPQEVPSNEDGTIHIKSLTKLVEFFVAKGHPIYVNFNYGSTFKGACDDVAGAIASLIPILKKYNMYERNVPYEDDAFVKKDIRHGFWFHVDGALGAAYMPFVEKAMLEGKLNIDGYKFPHFDFRLPEVHSISMSGHKWIGAPFPCGIFMTKVKYQLLPPDDPMYIGSPDTTFAGSRSGFGSMILWDYFAKNSYEENIAKILKNQTLAKYIEENLKILQCKIKEDLWIDRTPLALTIRFKKPNKEIVHKYSLSCESLYVNGEERSYAHIYIMDHVKKETIDKLMEDLSNENAFKECSSIPVKNEKINENSIYVNMLGRSFK